MDALLLRSLQGYVLDTFGVKTWQEICCRAETTTETFEPMLRYAAGTADRVAQLAAAVLGRPVESVWEDVGIYLVTSPDSEGVRRLLRFGGTSYVDFLHSLEELPGRARLALPGLELPDVALEMIGPDRYQVSCGSQWHGAQRALVGILSAMADDYGALCLIDAESDEKIVVSVMDSGHAKARRFDLAIPEQ